MEGGTGSENSSPAIGRSPQSPEMSPNGIACRSRPNPQLGTTPPLPLARRTDLVVSGFKSMVIDENDAPEVFSDEELSGEDLVSKYFGVERKLSDFTGVVNEEPDKKEEWKTKEGPLYKIGGNSGVWQKRWFVLSKDSLSYYPNAERKRMLGQVMLEDITKVQLNPTAMVFAVNIAGRAYYLGKGLSKDELNEWLEAINYNWVQTKRRAVKMSNRVESPEFIADRAYCLESQMMKRGGTNSKWQKRAFFLSGQFITYKKGTSVAGRIPLSSVTNIQATDVIKDKPNSFAIITPFRVYYLEALTREDKEKWVKGLNQNLKVSRFNADAQESLIEGFLYKEGNNGIWRRRFFIMHKDSLSYYFDQRQEKTLGTIELFKISQVNLDVSSSQPNSFSLVTPQRQYKLATSRAADRPIWVELIKEYTSKQNIY
eukprot:TRINITY_DN5714_c0_g1_i3.p1 TRINITY_DN5714_c0_g1~~TRINITY_DN5714_c0_g1_i3.p1  ORF type:complete len:428 (-),score=99.14 TRINITY_DN5714_c0_g1_i3:98-1381(-)